MPVAYEFTASGRLAPPPDVFGTFAGQVENADYPVATFEGTVSRAVADSWDASTIYTRPRVKLNGAWIPDSDLVYPLRGRRSIDTHTADFEFGLLGAKYSIFRTVTTWTRTAVELYHDHGQPGAVRVAETPTWAGYVVDCQQEQGSRGPMVRVKCGDHAALYERYEACEEVPPGAGYTRGQAARLFLEAAGISQVTGPDGAVFTKALQWTNKRLFSTLQQFIEPEGWHMRFRPDGTLEFYTAALKRAPQPPDHVWHAHDFYEPPKAMPPRNVPSHWTINATGVTLIDELGVETTITKTQVFALYAIVVATDRQAANTGTITPTGLTAPAEQLQLISRVTDQLVKQGSKVLAQTTIDEGFHNPSRAIKVTDSLGGFTPISAYITADGDYVHWLSEKFHEIGRREARHSYNLNDDLTGTVVDTWKYHLTTRGVATVAAYPADNINDTYIHGDDQSYRESHEAYGLESRHVVSLLYDQPTGAQLQEIQETYRWYSPASAIDGDPSWYVLHNGTGQKDLNASFMRVERRERTHILSTDVLVKGEQEVIYGFSAPKKADGTYDFGEFKSDAQEMVLRFNRIESTEYNVLAEDMYEKVTYTPEGGRTARVFLGSLPVTRYTQSVWTKMVQQPIEVSIEDPTAHAWFGFSKEVFTHDYVQNPEEAMRVLETKRRRAMSYTIEGRRPATGAIEGQTVLLIDPEQGIFGRCVITEVQPEWPGIGADETYRLEMPL